MAAPDLPHLPDLPDAGYATRRERELTDSIMLAMRAIERDRLQLLSIVLDGQTKWRRVLRTSWRGLRISNDLADAMYAYFTLQAAPPAFQRELLDAQQNPWKWRAIVRLMWSNLEKQREGLRAMQRRA
jgi:hypothetical protein